MEKKVDEKWVAETLTKMAQGDDPKAFAYTIRIGPEEPLEKFKRQIHERLAKMKKDGRTKEDFRMNALAIHYTALQTRVKNIVTETMFAHARNPSIDIKPIQVFPIAEQDVMDAADMLHNAWQRGVEDQKEKDGLLADRVKELERTIQEKNGYLEVNDLAIKAARRRIEALDLKLARRRRATKKRGKRQ